MARKAIESAAATQVCKDGLCSDGGGGVIATDEENVDSGGAGGNLAWISDWGLAGFTSVEPLAEGVSAGYWGCFVCGRVMLHSQVGAALGCAERLRGEGSFRGCEGCSAMGGFEKGCGEERGDEGGRGNHGVLGLVQVGGMALLSDEGKERRLRCGWRFLHAGDIIFTQ